MSVATLSQADTGELRGRVTDRGNAGLTGVSVSVSGPSLPSPRTAVTDMAGLYRIADVPAGTYTVEFQLAGFDTLTRQRIIVDAKSRVDVDATLEIGWAPPDLRVERYVPPRHPARELRRGEVLVHAMTSLGEIDIAVDPVHAPITSSNFLKYVDGGFYTNSRFHRATRADNYTVNLPNRPLLECVQAGINPARRAESFPPIPLERTSVTGLTHIVGTVSMARGGPDSATSDFFILINDQPSLDYGGLRFDDGQGAAAFGRVVAGMDVVRTIQRQPTEGQSLTPPVRILEIARVVKR